MFKLKSLSLSGAAVKRAASEFWRIILLLGVALTVIQFNVNGYLPERIRVMIELSKQGRDFTVEESGEYFADEFERLTGYTRASSSTVSFCALQAKTYAFAGQGQGLSEPAKVLFVVLATEKCRVVIELVNPTSKL